MVRDLGMVPFAIGSETAGSMTYPASRCGVTAIRPSFGAVGRTGVMSISESLVLPFYFSSLSPLFVLHPYFLDWSWEIQEVSI